MKIVAERLEPWPGEEERCWPALPSSTPMNQRRRWALHTRTLMIHITTGYTLTDETEPMDETMTENMSQLKISKVDNDDGKSTIKHPKLGNGPSL